MPDIRNLIVSRLWPLRAVSALSNLICVQKSAFISNALNIFHAHVMRMTGFEKLMRPREPVLLRVKIRERPTHRRL